MADNTLTLIISAQDDATKVIVKVGNAVKDVGEKTKDTAKQQTSMFDKAKTGWQAMAGAIGVVVGAIYTARRAYDYMIGSTVEYAVQVKKLAEVSQTSYEETSRLIQVADDFRITTDQLTLATKLLAKQGLSPTIDNIAKLSDQYNNLSTGAEKAAFLVKYFGRSGLEMATMMQKGGDALKKMGEEVSDNLILTGDAIQKAEAYRLALDNLGDSATGLGNRLGIGLFPVLDDAVKWMSLLIDETTALPDAFIQADNQGATLAESFKYLGKVAREDLIEALKDIYPNLAELIDAGAKGAAKNIQNVKGANDELKDYASTLQEVLGYARELGNYQDQRGVLEAQLALARKQGYSEWGTKIKDIKADIEALEKTHRDAMTQWISDAYQAQLAADGLFDDADMKKVLDYQRAMGLLSDEEYQAALNAIALKEALENIPENTEYTVTEYLNIIKTGHSGSGKTNTSSGTVTGTASGGPLNKGGWTMVGDAPGGKVTPYTELISPSGYVYNAAQTRGILAAGIVTPRAMARGSGGSFSIFPVLTGGTYAGLPQTSASWGTGASTASRASDMSAGGMSSGGMSAGSAMAITLAAQQNDTLISEIRALRTDIARAVRDAVQQVV